MSEHIVSKQTYYRIFYLLLFLTALTVTVATFDLGRLNTVVALAIAITKAVLVLLIFMHLRYSSRLTWLVVATGIVWLVILIALTMSDVVTRSVLAVAP